MAKVAKPKKKKTFYTCNGCFGMFAGAGVQTGLIGNRLFRDDG